MILVKKRPNKKQNFGIKSVNNSINNTHTLFLKLKKASVIL